MVSSSSWPVWPRARTSRARPLVLQLHQLLQLVLDDRDDHAAIDEADDESRYAVPTSITCAGIWRLRAFDSAWKELSAQGVEMNSEEQLRCIRTKLAQRIMELRHGRRTRCGAPERVWGARVA